MKDAQDIIEGLEAQLAEAQKLNATLREELKVADSECEKAFNELNAQTDKQSLFRYHSLTDDLRKTKEQLTAMTAERDALERINDAITDIGVYPSKIIGGPNAYEERTQWHEGWNAFSTELHRVNVEAHNKEKKETK